LGTTSLELRELEQLVRGSAASFRLLILDACRSGALTRVKGGTPIPPFEIQLGERVAGEGAVFLTSSSASEDSQESDEIKGSFFTHALVSGLLGAADANSDGRVTLDETYRYAYDATLRASSRSLAGVQHPTFEYDVRGMGAGPGVALGMAVALRSFTLKPRIGWCRGGFSNPGIEATVDQFDLELSAAYVRDLEVVSVEVGLTAGAALLVQRFRTQGVAP